MRSFALDTAFREEGGFVVRSGKIFEIGVFPDKQFTLSEEEARGAVERFRPAPINLEHRSTVLDGKLGELRRIWMDGKDIYGEAALPEWFDAQLEEGGRKVSCEWNRETKTLEGLGIVLSPRVTGAALMAYYNHTEARWDRAGEGRTGRMSLREKLMALFQRAGVPKEEVDAHLADVDLEAVEEVGPGRAANAEAPVKAAERECEIGAMATSRPLSPHLRPADFTSTAEFRQMQATMESQRSEIARLNAQFADAQKAAQFAADRGAVESWVRAMKMTPAEAEEWKKIAQDSPAAFAAARPALEARTPLPQLTGRFMDGECARAERAGGDPDGEKLHNLALAYAKDNGVEYAAAFSAMCRENPALAASYRATMEGK